MTLKVNVGRVSIARSIALKGRDFYFEIKSLENGCEVHVLYKDGFGSKLGALSAAYTLIGRIQRAEKFNPLKGGQL